MASKQKAWQSVAVTAVGVGVLQCVALQAPAAPNPRSPAYLDTFPHFDASITPQLPGDVDVALKKRLEDNRRFAEVQRLFDLWSWQAFITLNWPTNNAGSFAPSLTDSGFGPPDWTTWYESPTIFREDGRSPSACSGGAAHTLLSLSLGANVAVARDLKPFVLPPAFNKREIRLLGNISAVGERSPLTPVYAKGTQPTPLSEIKQAFAAPVIDQNGNFVFYEIMIDPHEVNYICAHALYNVNGQVAFTKGNQGASVDLPRGIDTEDGSGAWELKLAWRILTKTDDKSRYLSFEAIIPPKNGKTCPDRGDPAADQCKVDVGLVGMHIGHKTTTSPQWIWATFEQVDNLSVNNVAHPGLKPSFFNPNCPICVPNQPPRQNADGTWQTSPPTQVVRAIPIPADKIALNNQAEAALTRVGSVLRYYQLIDTQWPTQPSAAPADPEAGLPNAVENKSGGGPVPVFLTNITMETYFQTGVQAACNQEEAVDCPPTNWLTQHQVHARVSDTTSIFASESCMGCHSSAGLYIAYNPKTGEKSTGGQLMGDFSWLFTQKAHPEQMNH